MKRGLARLLVVVAAVWTVVAALATALFALQAITKSGGGLGKSLSIVPILIAMGTILVGLGVGALLVGLRRSGWRQPMPAWLRRLGSGNIAAGVTLALAFTLWAFTSCLLVANFFDGSATPMFAFDFYAVAGLWLVVVIPCSAGWFLYAAAVALRASAQVDPATRYFASVLLSFGICWAGLAGLCTATFSVDHYRSTFEDDILFPALSIAFGLLFALVGWSLRASVDEHSK